VSPGAGGRHEPQDPGGGPGVVEGGRRKVGV
jgi:hypothetical protein